MTALFAGLLANPTIIAIVVGILGSLGWGFHQRLSGAKAERNAQKAKEADAYEQHLHDIEAAANAASDVRADDGGVHDDPNNRDRKS